MQLRDFVRPFVGTPSPLGALPQSQSDKVVLLCTMSERHDWAMKLAMAVARQWGITDPQIVHFAQASTIAVALAGAPALVIATGAMRQDEGDGTFGTCDVLDHLREACARASIPLVHITPHSVR